MVKLDSLTFEDGHYFSFEFDFKWSQVILASRKTHSNHIEITLNHIFEIMSLFIEYSEMKMSKNNTFGFSISMKPDETFR